MSITDDEVIGLVSGVDSSLCCFNREGERIHNKELSFSVVVALEDAHDFNSPTHQSVIEHLDES